MNVPQPLKREENNKIKLKKARKRVKCDCDKNAGEEKKNQLFIGGFTVGTCSGKQWSLASILTLLREMKSPSKIARFHPPSENFY